MLNGKRCLAMTLVLFMLILTGCTADVPQVSDASQTDSVVPVQTTRIESKLLGMSFAYPENWVKDLDLQPNIEFAAGAIDKVKISLISDTVPEEFFDQTMLVRLLRDRMDGFAVVDQVLDFQCYELEHMDVIRLRTKLEPYFDDSAFRGDASYFTYWFINHHSGYSYIVECSEADKKFSCAASVDEMIGSMQFLGMPTGLADAIEFLDFRFYLAFFQQQIGS